MYKTLVQETTHVETDELGNRIIYTDSKLYRHKIQPDQFYNFFLDYIKWMLNINSVVPIKVLLCLMYRAEFNTGRVEIATCCRNDIMAELHIDKTSLSRAIKVLVDNEALLKCYKYDRSTGEQIEEKSAYTINPIMFWKGDLKKRSELTVKFEIS